MRMLLEVELPAEPFNSMVRNGAVGQKLQEIFGEIQPEAAYFTERDGHRGAILVVDVADPSQVPQLAEPFFLVFNALVKFRICMTPEDLGRAGLEAIGSKYA